MCYSASFKKKIEMGTSGYIIFPLKECKTDIFCNKYALLLLGGSVHFCKKKKKKDPVFFNCLVWVLGSQVFKSLVTPLMYL